MKYLIIFLLLASCSRNPADVGKTVKYVGWECVKSDISPGMSMNGDFTMSSTCSVSKCFETEYVLGKSIFSKKLIVRKLVPDENCL